MTTNPTEGRTLSLTIDASYYRGMLAWARIPLAIRNGEKRGTLDITDQHGGEVSEQHVAEKLLAALLDVWTEYGQPTDPIPEASLPADLLAERRLRRAIGEIRRASDLSPLAPDSRIESAVEDLAAHARDLLTNRSNGGRR